MASSGSPEAMMRPASGPPYAPQVAVIGGVPTIALDVPICAVFLLLFVIAAAGHMTIFQLNNRRGHKFVLSALMFGFCMARISTLALRIAWATHPSNVSIVIAANVLVAAGVVILFVVDLLLAQRIVRATHPNFGWHRWFSLTFKLFYALLIVSLCMLVGLTVTTFFTLDPNLRRIARDIQLYGSSAFLLLCFLPIPLVLGSILLPHPKPIDKFGTGRFRTKVVTLLIGSTLLTLGAAFRLSAAAFNPRPITDPAWYQSKPCFYCFNFVIELVVLYLYLAVRADRRFHIPNGAKGPGAYRGGSGTEKDTQPSSNEAATESLTVLPEIVDDGGDLDVPKVANGERLQV